MKPQITNKAHFSVQTQVSRSIKNTTTFFFFFGGGGHNIFQSPEPTVEKYI